MTRFTWVELGINFNFTKAAMSNKIGTWYSLYKPFNMDTLILQGRSGDEILGHFIHCSCIAMQKLWQGNWKNPLRILHGLDKKKEKKEIYSPSATRSLSKSCQAEEMTRGMFIET